MSQSGPTTGDIASLEYELVSSALAFLTRSVETFNDRDSDHTLAFAIAELATAVEVLMKARLVWHDWTQVCINTTKTTWTFDQLANGVARTVRPEDAVAGLKAAGVGIEPHTSAIKRLASSRNRAVHFTLSNGGEHPEGVEAEYGAALDFVLWFLNSEFRELAACSDGIVAAVDDVIEDLTQVVGQIRVLVDARIETIAPELHTAAMRLVCPRCEQPALITRENQPPRCAFCLWDPADGRSAIDEYVDVDHRAETNAGPAPRCGATRNSSATGTRTGVHRAPTRGTPPPRPPSTTSPGGRLPRRSTPTWRGSAQGSSVDTFAIRRGVTPGAAMHTYEIEGLPRRPLLDDPHGSGTDRVKLRCLNRIQHGCAGVERTACSHLWPRSRRCSGVAGYFLGRRRGMDPRNPGADQPPVT